MAKAKSRAMSNPHKGHTGLRRMSRAARHSVDGLAAALRSKSAFRQECLGAAILLPLAFWVGQSWVETSLLVATVMLVLIVELLNSGIEAAIDRVSLELHDLSKFAKDLASAAVFLSILLCSGVWVTALFQRFGS